MKTNMLYYQTINSDPDKDWIVFVHGAGGNSNSWRKQVQFFKPYYNLLLVDLRDHGRSKFLRSFKDKYSFNMIARDVVDVLDHLKIQRAHFMGLSLGTLIIRLIEEKSPERVLSIIMAGGMFKMDWKLRIFSFSANYLAKVLPFDLIYAAFAWIVMPRKNHSYSRRVFIRFSKQLEQSAYMRWLTLYQEFHRVMKNLFSKPVTSPCLIVMGSEDHIFLKPAQEWVQKHQNAILEEINKAGHICSIDASDKFNQLCLEFLNSQKIVTVKNKNYE